MISLLVAVAITSVKVGAVCCVVAEGCRIVDEGLDKVKEFIDSEEMKEVKDWLKEND